MRLLYVAHGHPALATGGGELAAWRLFRHFSNLYGEMNCGFLAAAPQVLMPHGCELMGLGPRQWLIPAAPYASTLVHDTWLDLRTGCALHQALLSLDPDIIHFHHYLHIGVDLLHALKRWFPSVKVCLTLHEYWGMCAYEGRLLRRSGALCLGGNIEECTACVGPDQREVLSIRSHRIRRFFGAIDHFISPSYFLKCRYLHWGLDPVKLSVIENLPAQHVSALQMNRGRRNSGQRCLTVGFLGQVNPWKGIDLILKAVYWARVLQPDSQIRLRLHGLSWQRLHQPGDPYLQRCADLIQLIGAEGVEVCGHFVASELTKRLAGLDAVVMGSIWYENSPMVIQEAYQHGLPVLAPQLGGMAEKVKHMKTGLLFESGRFMRLTECLLHLADDPGLLDQLSTGAARAARRLCDAAYHHQQLYHRLLTV